MYAKLLSRHLQIPGTGEDDEVTLDYHIEVHVNSNLLTFI